MSPSEEIGLNRRVLSRVDSKLRSELDGEKGEWLVKVGVSCGAGGLEAVLRFDWIPMGHGLAVLLHHELASIVDEDAETLTDRLRAREAELEARARKIKEREKELNQRDRVLVLFKADVEQRERDVAARERNVAVVEHDLAPQLIHVARPEVSAEARRKLGRNELCWCNSGKKYKNCRLPLEG